MSVVLVVRSNMLTIRFSALIERSQCMHCFRLSFIRSVRRKSGWCSLAPFFVMQSLVTGQTSLLRCWRVVFSHSGGMSPSKCPLYVPAVYCPSTTEDAPLFLLEHGTLE